MPDLNARRKATQEELVCIVDELIRKATNFRELLNKRNSAAFGGPDCSFEEDVKQVACDFAEDADTAKGYACRDLELCQQGG